MILSSTVLLSTVPLNGVAVIDFDFILVAFFLWVTHLMHGIFLFGKPLR